MSTDEKADLKDDAKGSTSSVNPYNVDKPNAELEQKAHFNGASVQVVMILLHRPIMSAEFIEYFSEWHHAKILIGTCACWFLLDTAWVLPCPLFTARVDISPSPASAAST